MSGPSLFYYNDQWGKVQPQVLRLQFEITAAKTVKPIVSNSASLTTFDAIAAQATIDDFLGTSSEFTAAQFDATSMGADAFGVIVDMKGQAKSVVQMVARCYSNTGGADLVTRQAKGGSLAASTLETAVACGASGNVAGKVVFGNTPDFDGLTAGVIDIEIHWIAK
jgi:hypothetical protein